MSHSKEVEVDRVLKALREMHAKASQSAKLFYRASQAADELIRSIRALREKLEDLRKERND